VTFANRAKTRLIAIIEDPKTSTTQVLRACEALMRLTKRKIRKDSGVARKSKADLGSLISKLEQ
jgi:hypothetical protein